MQHFAGRVIWCALCLALMSVNPTHANPKTGQLSVQIEGLRSDLGHMKCLLYSDAAGWPEIEAAALKIIYVSIHNRTATCTFKGLPYGNYAVTVLHDSNDSRKMEFSLIGIPKEGFGFSNGAKSGTLGAPSFAESAVSLATPIMTTPIVIEHF